jgi:hypothetical protein
MATGSTIQYAFPFPVSTDPVNVSGDIQQLATKIDNILQETIEDTSADMWTGGTFSNGINVPTYNDTTGKMSMSLVQNISTSACPTFGGVNVSGSATINGNINANSGTIATNKTTFNLANTIATTINFGGAATTIAIGNSSGQINAAGDISVASGKVYKINNASVLSNTTLGSSVVNSSLTSVGTISSGMWNATTIAVNRGGTGITSFVVGDIVYASASAALAKLGIGGNNHVLTSNGTAPVWSANTGTGNVVRATSPALSGTPTAPTASAGTNTTQIATTAFVETALALGEGLPSQTGNNGKFLTTDGAVASWANVPSPNNGTLTMNTSGTGISGSATFTANQSTGSTFTVTITSASAATANTLALRTSTGGLNAVSPTAAGSVGLRQTYMSTANPSGGNDGDVWLKHE